MANNWDLQKMLDQYILDYLTKKELYHTAVIFAKESNLEFGQPVAINTPEGFLTEWWSIFFDVFQTRANERAKARAEWKPTGDELQNTPSLESLSLAQFVIPPELKPHTLSQYQDGLARFNNESPQIRNVPNQMIRVKTPQQYNSEYFSTAGLSQYHNELARLNRPPRMPNMPNQVVQYNTPQQQNYSAQFAIPPELKRHMLSQYQDGLARFNNESPQIRNVPNQMIPLKTPQQIYSEYYSTGGISQYHNELARFNGPPQMLKMLNMPNQMVQFNTPQQKNDSFYKPYGSPAVNNSVPFGYGESNSIQANPYREPRHNQDLKDPQHLLNFQEILNHADPFIQSDRNVLIDALKTLEAENRTTTFLMGNNRQQVNNELSELMPPPRQIFSNQPESEKSKKQKTDEGKNKTHEE